MSLGTTILVSEIGNLVLSVLPVPQWLNDLFAEEIIGAEFSLSAILTVAVLPAIFEEILCRGLVLRALLKRYSSVVSIVVSALMFGVIHLNPWQFVTAFLLGILLGWIVLKTGSIVLTVIAHFLNNFIFLAISFTGDMFSIPGFNAGVEGGGVVFQPWWFDLLGLGLFLVGLGALRWVFRRV
jgi:membrane protease YdiL (CAAX protease family)